MTLHPPISTLFPYTTLFRSLQTEYSLFERNVEEAGILATLQELQIGFVAYSPLGRGFISGDIKTPDDFPENDFRKAIPDRKSTRLNSSHVEISYAVFCLKKK